MVKLIRMLLLSTLASFALVGCSSDRCQVISHPSVAKPGDTINVVLTDFYLYGSITNKVLSQVVRDSFHLVTGVPNNCEVLSAEYYAAKDFNVASVMRTEDTSVIIDSALAYVSRVVPMKTDTALARAFRGRQISGHDITSTNNKTVNTASIGKLVGFSSLLGLTLPANSDVDTVIQIDSLVALSKRLGVDSNQVKKYVPSIPSYVKQIGVKVIPVCAVLKIKVQSEVALDTFYYYTKTAALPPVTSTEPYDIGDMVYVPLTVSNVGVRHMIATIQRNSIRVESNHSGIQIYGLNPKSDLNVGIYSLSGELLRSIRSNKGSSVAWNGIDQNGKTVGNGKYVVRITDGKEMYSQQISIVK